MPSRSTTRLCARVVEGVESKRRQSALPFASAFSSTSVARILQDEARAGARESGPFASDVTLFAFLSQVLDDDPSCAAAVERINADRIARGLGRCSPHTSSYCKARERLSPTLLPRLCRACADDLETEVPAAWLWQGRHVKLIDGTMLTAPDTPSNRAAFPQHHAYREGLGFPMLRLVALTSLATGAVIDAELGPSRGQRLGELSLACRLLRSVDQGDVVVGDRLYPGYPFVASVQVKGADFVGRRKSGPRPVDFRRGIRLGKDDHIVRWQRPKSSASLSHEELAALPETLAVREVRVKVKCPGRKPCTLCLVTTLLSRTEFPPHLLGKLYFARWHMELDLLAIKQVLHMDRLRCSTPAMLGREVWAHLLAYNLVRRLMAMAAASHDIEPRRLSFKGAVQTLRACGPLLAHASRRRRKRWLEAMLEAIASKRITYRPGRSEPRQIKYNPKHYDMLKTPRGGLRAAS